MATDRTNVVDLARYRRRRQARDERDLPLFDGPPEPPAERPAGPPSSVTADRPLADRQVAHRRRMLAHLAGAMLSECRN
jgi:hypothetical protein